MGRTTSAHIYAWMVASVGTMFLLVEHVRPSESALESAYALGLCASATSLVMMGAAACLDALGA